MSDRAGFPEDYVYVIMPVSVDILAEKKKEILGRRAKDGNLTVHFPMDHVGFQLDSGDVLSRTVSKMAGAVLVIADLSFERPSCYYELGLAEASGANVAPIALTGSDIHQSANRGRVSYYSDLASYERVIERVLKAVQ